ncbi:uncharacterized protein LOC144649811 [Oculina patagonica]
MARPGSPWNLLFVLLLLSAISSTISKTPSTADLSHVSQSQKGSCHNMYTYNNIYPGSSKEIETLLPEVKKELAQIRKEINCLKENKMISKGPTFKKIEALFQEVKKELGEIQEEIKIFKRKQNNCNSL